MSHARRADRLLIKPTAGARPASPCTPGRFIPKTHKDAVRRLMSHERHDDNQPGDGP